MGDSRYGFTGRTVNGYIKPAQYFPDTAGMVTMMMGNKNSLRLVLVLFNTLEDGPGFSGIDDNNLLFCLLFG